MRFSVFYFVMTMLCIMLAAPVYAQVTTIQAIEFGEFVSKRNDAQYDVTINTNGSYTFDSAGFIELTAPQEGIYDIGGFANNATIASVVVTQNTPLGSNPAAQFQMVNFQETHPATTDGSGVARITIGATARTSGDGNPYGDATYSGSIDITVNF